MKLQIEKALEYILEFLQSTEPAGTQNAKQA